MKVPWRELGQSFASDCLAELTNFLRMDSLWAVCILGQGRSSHDLSFFLWKAVETYAWVCVPFRPRGTRTRHPLEWKGA
jgi:hypothetical protein